MTAENKFYGVSVIQLYLWWLSAPKKNYMLKRKGLRGLCADYDMMSCVCNCTSSVADVFMYIFHHNTSYVLIVDYNLFEKKMKILPHFHIISVPLMVAIITLIVVSVYVSLQK